MYQEALDINSFVNSREPEDIKEILRAWIFKAHIRFKRDSSSTDLSGEKQKDHLNYEEENMTTAIEITQEPQVDETEFEPISVQFPPKRVLASMNVELSEKDFKKRLPKPIIFPESEVE